MHIPQPETQPKTIRYQCRHIFTEGRRCKSPALHSQPFCYFHQENRPQRRALLADPAAFQLPTPEDRPAIQVALGLILDRLAQNQLDPKRAGLMLYCLQIASANLPKQARPEPHIRPESLTSEVEIHETLGPIAPQIEFDETLDDGRRRGFTLEELLMQDWEKLPPRPASEDEPANQNAPIPLIANPLETPETQQNKAPQPTQTSDTTESILPNLEASATPSPNSKTPNSRARSELLYPPNTRHPEHPNLPRTLRPTTNFTTTEVIRAEGPTLYQPGPTARVCCGKPSEGCRPDPSDPQQPSSGAKRRTTGFRFCCLGTPK